MNTHLLKLFSILALFMVGAGRFASADDLDSGPIAASQVTLLPDPGVDALQARFGKVPPLGVHPRVLFGPDELTTIRQSLKTTTAGAQVFSRIESYINVLHKPGQPLATTYDHLVQGDLDAFKYATTDWWRKNCTVALAYDSLDALVRQDAEKGKGDAAALVTAAQITKGLSNLAPDPDLSMILIIPS